MTRSHHALILGSDPAGELAGIVVMEIPGTAAQLQAAVARTRADMERRGLKVTIQVDGRLARAADKKQRPPNSTSRRLH